MCIAWKSRCDSDNDFHSDFSICVIDLRNWKKENNKQRYRSVNANGLYVLCVLNIRYYILNGWHSKLKCWKLGITFRISCEMWIVDFESNFQPVQWIYTGVLCVCAKRANVNQPKASYFNANGFVCYFDILTVFIYTICLLLFELFFFSTPNFRFF